MHAAHSDDAVVRDLWERARQGDREAFEAVYIRYAATLVRIATAYTQSVAVAEDVVQDLFLHLWTHRTEVRVDRHIGVYLASAARNRALDRTKHRRIAEGVARTVRHGAMELPLAGGFPQSASAMLESEEFAEAYAKALALLAERERLAFLLRLDEGMTFEEIGAVLGISKVGVRKLVLRVHAKLRTLLAAYRY